MSCAARRCNDQMHCGPCGVQWDVSDPEPPPCGLECVGAASPSWDEDASKTFIPPQDRYHLPGGSTGDLLDPEFLAADVLDIDLDDIPHTYLEHDQ